MPPIYKSPTLSTPYLKSNQTNPYIHIYIYIYSLSLSLSLFSLLSSLYIIMSTIISKMDGVSNNSSKRAYVTFLAGNGDYVKGVVGLAKGLRKVKSAYPLVVAILDDVPEEHRQILRSQGCIVRLIDPVYPPNNTQTQFAMAYYVINYSKLRIWGFEEYEKMVYLDGDIQVFENIDHLFEWPNGYFYAVMDCFCEKVWNFSTQYKIGYCQQCPERVPWPAESGSPPPLYFNAGMFVSEPSLVTYHNLMEALETTPPTAFAEQDFLNMFFKDIYKPIPNVYNLVLAMLWRHPENVDFDNIKVAHYCAALGPFLTALATAAIPQNTAPSAA
ncbi:hypothetical protein CsatB_025681 [Cannabis sativa]